jgi:phosphoribosylamine--glycine ligase
MEKGKFRVRCTRGEKLSWQSADGDKISGLKKQKSHPDAIIFHAGTSKNETGEYITAGGRVLGVTATGENLDEALRKAYGAVSEIFWDGMLYRRDIGKHINKIKNT